MFFAKYFKKNGFCANSAISKTVCYFNVTILIKTISLSLLPEECGWQADNYKIEPLSRRQIGMMDLIVIENCDIDNRR